MKALYSILLVSLLALAACGTPPPDPADAARGAELVVAETPGNGDEASPGSRVAVHYTGWLYDAEAPDHKGKKFDSSVDRGRPFSFILGAGQVIEGWDLGVAGMRVGGERTLVIPSDLAYGGAGAGDAIPPNATLVFDVKLIGVVN